MRTRPAAVRERCCCCRRDWRLECEAESEAAIVSRPEISKRRLCRSVVSALPRIEPTALWKNDSVGPSDNLR